MLTALPFCSALPRHTPLSSFFRSETFLKPRSSIRDFAWPSVKLFAPATGAPGLGGLFGELTAGVLASRFAGGRADCAIAGMVEAIRANEMKMVRIAVPQLQDHRELPTRHNVPRGPSGRRCRTSRGT